MTRKYTKNTGHFIPTKPTDNSNSVCYTGPARNFFLRMCAPSSDFVHRSRETSPYTVVDPIDYLDHLNQDLIPGNCGVKKMQQHLEYIFSNLSEEGQDWIFQKLFGDITEAGKNLIIAGMAKNNNVSEALHQLGYLFEHYRTEEDDALDTQRLSADGWSETDFQEMVLETLETIYNTLEMNRQIQSIWGSEGSDAFYDDPSVLRDEIFTLTEHLVTLKNQHKQVQMYAYCKKHLKLLEERGIIEISPPEFLPEPTVKEIIYD